MEVTVIKLRELGRKLPEERVRAEPPLRGHLEIAHWHLKNHTEDRIVKELVLKTAPTATCAPTARLVNAQQTRLKGDDMVYVGTETVAGVVYAQAWWCRLAPQRPAG